MRSLILKKFSTPFSKSLILLAMPLVLSSITHLWNPIGFPTVHTDEGHYMLRVMNVLEGSGPQEPKSIYTKPFDHPYFGQIFLASMLALVGYPDSLQPSADGDVHSVEMLFMVPRILMGLLAVVDTFLVYKISERRYNRNIAFIAAILFAVMPITWMLRRVLLENLLLPFLLSSILFPLYLKGSGSIKNYNSNPTKNQHCKNVLVTLSGLFLGLGIFTKLPVFALVPLVAFIVFRNSNNSWKTLGIWFIPVILIPMMWPTYAISMGKFHEWQENVLWQATGRIYVPISDAMRHFYNMDPVLLVLGIAGLVFCIIKRDLIIILWFIPYLIFISLIGHVEYWHLILILPLFCLAGARLLVYLLSYIPAHMHKIKNISYFTTISAIAIFGLISICSLIITSVTSGYFQTLAFIVHYLPDHKKGDKDPADNKVTFVGGRWVPGFSWIITYIFDKEVDFKKFYINSEIKTPKVLLIVDSDFRRFLSSDKDEKSLQSARMLLENTEKISEIKDKSPPLDSRNYPYSIMKIVKRQTMLSPIEIRTNY